MKSLKIRNSYLIFDEERLRFYMANDGEGQQCIATAACQSGLEHYDVRVVNIYMAALSTVLIVNDYYDIESCKAEIINFVKTFPEYQTEYQIMDDISIKYYKWQCYHDPLSSAVLCLDGDRLALVEIWRVASVLHVETSIFDGDTFHIASTQISSSFQAPEHLGKIVCTAVEAELHALGIKISFGGCKMCPACDYAWNAETNVASFNALLYWVQGRTDILLNRRSEKSVTQELYEDRVRYGQENQLKTIQF